ncbi:unnamed protein product, partial [Effrenium voratum]
EQRGRDRWFGPCLAGSHGMVLLLRAPLSRLPRWAWIARRHLHKGYVGTTLEKLSLPRHHWLKEVEQAPEKSTVRRMKDRYLRELGSVHQELSGLFRDEKKARGAIEEHSEAERQKLSSMHEQRELKNEALRVYRLLRPDAPPFFEEDAMLSMKAKMNRIAKDEDDQAGIVKAEKFGDPFKAYLPVVNQKAFLLALESVTASLAQDLETLCVLANPDEQLPDADDPLRFKKLVDILFGIFQLEKDPGKVDAFMDRNWAMLQHLLPEEIVHMDPSGAHVARWLKGHLERVILNQQRYEEADQKIFLHKNQSQEAMYNFAEDFAYDDDPMPGFLADERNLDFPLEKAKEYMQLFLNMLSSSARARDVSDNIAPGAFAAKEDAETVAEQFQDFVWDLEDIGLRNWLKMDLRELESHLPKDVLAPLVYGQETLGDLLRFNYRTIPRAEPAI